MSPSHPIQPKRYDADTDLSIDSTHTRVMRLVGRDKRVLELGCATGYMSRALTTEFGCVVTGVEVNPDAAAEARKICARVIVGDLDGMDWNAELGEEQFDVVVAADVLEHLRNPARVLEGVRMHLAPGGHLVASIPNVAHASVLAELLEGRFQYQPFGLLDDTHIRFFTRDSIQECLEEAGFAITHLDRLTLEPSATEFRTSLASLPPEVSSWLLSREEAQTYQFILVARPMPEGRTGEQSATWPRTNRADASASYREILTTLPGDPGVDSAHGLLQAHAARVAFLENTRVHQEALIAALREVVEKHERYIAAVTTQSEARGEELAKAQTYVTSLLAEIDKLKEELKTRANYPTDLQRAMDASMRRLLQERERLGDALEENRRELREQTSRLTVALEELKEHVRHQQQTIARLEGRIMTYEHSRSWRLTAPLRALMRVVMRLPYRP